MTAFKLPAVPARLRAFTGPSVWLESGPLAALTRAVNLGQGFPDWDAPPFVAKAAAAAVGGGEHAQYARSAGLPALVEGVARVYGPRVVPKRLWGAGRRIDALREVVVTVGASQGLGLAVSSVVGEGDDVVVVEPAFDIYRGAVSLAGGVYVGVPLVLAECGRELTLDMDALADALSERTRLLVLNSPHNPTGKVFSRTEYEQIAELLDRKAPSCVVISDEVYEHMVYAPHKHVPFASISESAFCRTLSVYSAGKTFSVTGWKVGWVVGPAEIIRRLQIMQQFVVFSVSTPLQAAIASALDTADAPYEGYTNYYEWLRARYERKRDILLDALHAAGLKPIAPQGAFFICSSVTEAEVKAAQMPSAVAKYIKDGDLEIDPVTENVADYNLCRDLACNAGVTAIPLSAFFSSGSRTDNPLSNSYIRFAFCKKDDVLLEARKRLLAWSLAKKGA